MNNYYYSFKKVYYYVRFDYFLHIIQHQIYLKASKLRNLFSLNY